MSDKKEDKDIDVEESRSAQDALRRLDYLRNIFIMVFLVTSFYLGHSIYDSNFTDEVSVTICPRTDSLDTPILMKTMKRANDFNKDKYIRGFIRLYLKYIFPRNGIVKDENDHNKEINIPLKYFTKVYNMTSNPFMRVKLERYINGSTKIAEAIDEGRYYRFYPVNSLDLKIFKKKGTRKWVAELDAYLIKHISLYDDIRYTPTIKIEIEQGLATNKNPHGLYVTDLKIKQIQNYQTGDVIEIDY